MFLSLGQGECLLYFLKLAKKRNNFAHFYGLKKINFFANCSFKWKEGRRYLYSCRRRLYTDVFDPLPATTGNIPNRPRWQTRFSPAEEEERESRRIEGGAWVARLFLSQLIYTLPPQEEERESQRIEGWAWVARLFLSQLIYTLPPPPHCPPYTPPPPTHLPRTREEGEGGSQPDDPSDKEVRGETGGGGVTSQEERGGGGAAPEQKRS